MGKEKTMISTLCKKKVIYLEATAFKRILWEGGILEQLLQIYLKTQGEMDKTFQE